ncbi:MAG: 4Fe-4S binding protein [Actinomycetota bacterium]|nr:4Fe-4S binding protein [Actinomycetota bacterium]
MVKESTKKVFRLHGWRVDRAIHYYIYFLFYDIYVRVALYATKAIVALFSRFEATKYIPKFIFDRYHAKVLSRSDVTKILDLEETVMLGPDTTGRIVPFKYANKIVLREPTHLAVMDCPCKKELKDPCQPLASCIAVGRPVVDFWMEHCQRHHVRRITKEEALEIIDRHRRSGHINQAFFKVATGGSMGVICNCCPRCCVSMRATALAQRIKGAKEISMYAPSGYTTRHDPGKCKLCGECVKACNFGAVEMVDGRRVYRPERCYGCELCVENCPNGALELVLEEGGLIPLDMELLREKLG